jgi:hypothetical protein
MASVVLNGVTYTDDANASTGMANGGHRVRFVPCLADFVTEAATQLALQHASRDAADDSEAAALASELAAAASALSALNSPGTNATSVTSLTFGTGSKTLTIQTGKDLVVGQFVSIAYTPDANNWMQGVITAHNSGTGSLTVNVGAYKGTGTFTDWTIGLSGPDALPVQTGNAGKYLTTSGSVASWIVPPEFAAMRRQAFLAAGSASSAEFASQSATSAAKAAKRAAFMAAGNTLQVQQMAVVVANSASRSRSYFYGNF